MPIFGRVGIRPRLALELDDATLGRVCRSLNSKLTTTSRDSGARIAMIKKSLHDAGSDWDRRMHRMMVLAEATADFHLSRIWLDRQPQNADALVFQAWVTLFHGRATETMTGARTFIDNCYRAAEQCPNDPAPWVALLGVLRLRHRPWSEVYAIWREATVRDHWNREAHMQMVGYLSPQECGSFVRLLDFVDGQCSQMPSGAPAVGVELAAMVNRHRQNMSSGGLDALLSRRWWQQPPAVTAVDRALACWTKPAFLRHAAALADLNTLAFALVHANRLSDAAVIFGMIGETVTPWPWNLDGDPLKQYVYWLSRATR